MPEHPRIGLIARGDSRGLGVQTKAVYDNLHPYRTMVIDCPSANPLPVRRDWYPGATWIHGLPTATDFRVWLAGLDVVYSAETGYGKDLWSEAERVGVKTVLHANYEFLNRDDRPTLWAAPSTWHLSDFPDPKIVLPVPIETHRFPQRSRSVTARRFLHVVGRPAIHDRNGTKDLLAALQYVQADITVKITCQDPDYVPNLLSGHWIPGNVTLELSAGDVPDYWDLYSGSDVLVLPRRFGGLCLPCQEALGAGMPVIMPRISPNEWLPADWLAPATKTGEFMARQIIDLHTTDPIALADMIDRFAVDPSFYATAADQAQDLAKRLSWENMRPQYDEAFAELAKGQQ